VPRTESAIAPLTLVSDPVAVTFELRADQINMINAAGFQFQFHQRGAQGDIALRAVVIDRADVGAQVADQGQHTA